MARRVKPKISYKKKGKPKKAWIGAAIQGGLGLYKLFQGKNQRDRAQQALDDFDKDTLQMGVSKATQQMADEPIDEGYIGRLKDARLASQATAMQNLMKDPRKSLSGVIGLENQARKQELDLLGEYQDAKTKAMQNLAAEQKAVEQRRLDVVDADVEGIKGEMAAGQQNIYGGLEDIGGAVTSYAGDQHELELAKIKEGITEKGGSIKADKGGVTPGEFDHEGNPIDMVQDGEKIGEATGGELILPPNDVEEIRDALKDGDKNAAFELMEDLVAKYDSNVIGDKDDKAQDGAKVESPTIPPLDGDRANEIVKVMKDNADQVRNVGELPFDEDPTNPAGLVNYISGKLSFDLDSTSVAEIDFIKNYREHLIKEKGRADSPEMKGGGYLAKVKARVGAYMKSKY